MKKLEEPTQTVSIRLPAKIKRALVKMAFQQHLTLSEMLLGWIKKELELERRKNNGN